MDAKDFNKIVNFIFNIADDCLRDVYVRGKYRDVILPMTVIRRLDATLEPTKKQVLELKAKLDANGINNQSPALCNAAKQSFCNASPFSLKDLRNRSNKQQQIADFIQYIDGFSENVQEILSKFKFKNQIENMSDPDNYILGMIIEKFTSNEINLSPNPVLNSDGSIRLPALDNHNMGTLFEELIRRFNEENNEEAGEHFTPRDVVELMADLVLIPIADQLKDATYTCYDGACGTGGMLTVSEARIKSIAESKGKHVSIHIYGQENQPETYAIAKADLLLKGDGNQTDNIKYGSTLSADGLSSKTFDFMISNPPYGKTWKKDSDILGGKKQITDPRFVVSFKDDPEFKMIPKVNDGQLLFLLNNVSKMKNDTELGSRIAEIHNGSSIFTGNAGTGESNARRYVIERDLVEAIIALPERLFYNTPIGTYIWVLSNRKSENRKGKIQLIDATSFKSSLRRNLGDRNCEIPTDLRSKIMDIYQRFEENEYSIIRPNEEFGYWNVVINRPLYDAEGNPIKAKKGLKKDPTFKDEEQIPLNYEGGIQNYLETQVKPYIKDAWVDESKTEIGYEISFLKYFYKAEEPRPLSEIKDDIFALEDEIKEKFKQLM